MDPETTRAYFDERADHYENAEWHVRYAKRLVELADMAPGWHVLDAATGTGLAARAAATVVGPTGRVIGADISPGMLTQAVRHAPATVSYIQSDVTDLNEFDAEFDAVICASGMLYLPVDQALREWRRVLKPGGLVGFSTMREGEPSTARIFRACAADLGLSLTDPMAALGTEDRSEAALTRADFTPTHTIADTLTLPASDPSHAWRVLSTSPHYPELQTLSPTDLITLETHFKTTLPSTASITTQVIYAYGRKQE
ncbi:methyltransferase domain-containing protein [Streptosporangium soli]|nr:methyltransferase domain-containing protein [Streptosporangium sp. KLBMP 9127]